MKSTKGLLVVLLALAILALAVVPALAQSPNPPQPQVNYSAQAGRFSYQYEGTWGQYAQFQGSNPWYSVSVSITGTQVVDWAPLYAPTGATFNAQWR